MAGERRGEVLVTPERCLLGVQGSYFEDHLVYDAAADIWEQATSISGLCPTARGAHSAAWTGARMVVWGGFPVTDTGAAYDPATDTWPVGTALDATTPSARYAHTAVWTGSRMIVWRSLIWQSS